jgi:hypothetical protein
MVQRRKKMALTVKQKLRLLMKVENKESLTELARDHGIRD